MRGRLIHRDGRIEAIDDADRDHVYMVEDGDSPVEIVYFHFANEAGDGVLDFREVQRSRFHGEVVPLLAGNTHAE